MFPRILAAAFLAFTLAANPQATKPVQATNPCAKLTNQSDLSICADKEAKRADRELNALYNKIMAGLDDIQKPKLREVERAWVVYRDLECKEEGAQFEGGSMQPMVVVDCLKTQTDRRIQDLHGTYEAK